MPVTRLSVKSEMLIENTLPDLIEFFKDDLDEVLIEMAHNLTSIDDNLEDYFGIVDEENKEGNEKFKQALKDFQGTFRSHKAFLENTPTQKKIDLLLKIFQGLVPIFYSSFKELQEKHEPLLNGIEITEKSIFTCQAMLKTIMENANLQKTLYGLDIDWISHYLLFIDLSKIDSEKMKATVLRIRQNAQQMEYCKENFLTLTEHMTTSLWMAFLLHLLVKANEMGFNLNQEFDEENLFREISNFEPLQEGFKHLEQAGVPRTNIKKNLFNLYEFFKKTVLTTKAIDTLNPAVKRLRYLNQGLLPQAQLGLAYCLGGIRYWSELPLSKEKKDASIFRGIKDLNEVEVQAMMRTLQINQRSFNQKNKHGPHSCYTVKEEKIKAFEKPLILAEETKKQIILETIDTLMNSFPDLAEKYYYNCTIHVTLINEKSLHAIGFKFEQVDEKVYYHFCDYNNGEFYAEELKALKQWFKEYFYLMDYQISFVGYRVAVIRSKPTFSVLQALNFDRFDLEDSSSENGSFSQNKISRGMQVAYANYKKSISQEEVSDKKIRKIMEDLLPRIRKDDLSAKEEYVEYYKKLIQKHEEDHVMGISMLFDIEDEYKEFSKAIGLLKETEAIAKILISMHQSYHSLERKLWLVKAKHHLGEIQYAQEGVQLLHQFCQAIKLIKEEELWSPEGLEELQVLTLKLEEKIVIVPLSHGDVLPAILEVDGFMNEHPNFWLSESARQTITDKLFCDVQEVKSSIKIQ